MSGRQIGVVRELWRYPVKSLRGESLTEAHLTERGIEGDRRWALRELDRGGIMSARIWSALLQLRATRDDRGGNGDALVRIELPDGRALDVTDPATPAVLAELLGRKVELAQVRRERLSATELDAVILGDAYPPKRDFFDEDVIHIIASGTITHLRTLKPDSDFDPRRFRANILIDTGAEADGFIEDRWLDGVLEIGPSVKINWMRPAIRCVMTTHSQPDLPRDMAILRTAAQAHDAYVGVFAAVGATGRIRVGDPVVLHSEGASHHE
ncbi:MAG: MOSC domain-containing protein [Candidatus Binataceae bacterium]